MSDAVLDVVAVVADVEERWSVGAALRLQPGAAMDLDEAQARIAHPAVPAPQAVVLVLRDEDDAAWLDWHRSTSTRSAVPVVALVDGEGAWRAAEQLGADAVVSIDGPQEAIVRRVRAAVAAVGVTAPTSPVPRRRMSTA